MLMNWGRCLWVLLFGVLAGGCSVLGPDLTFEESVAEARASAVVVADAIGDSDRLERFSIGPLSCGFSNRYASLSAYLPLDVTPGEAELDRIAEVIGELGFVEDSRRQVAVGSTRLWEGADDVTISVTTLTAENAIRMNTRGRCAQPPE